MSSISKRILSRILERGMSYGELSERTGIPKSALQRYATGQTEKIPINRLRSIAEALDTTASSLMGWEPEESVSLPENILPLPQMKRVPLLGSIACGAPILAQEHIEDYVEVPAHINADFSLRCKGDSMINARIYDGDIVYIRQQETVESGQIAAVLIDGEATLKRVQIHPDRIILEPANPLYDPLVFRREEINSLRILGKAVAFTGAIR